MSTGEVAHWRHSPAVRAGLALAGAVGLYGVSFGALAVVSGFSAPQAVVLSLVMFTGGSQFALVGVVAGGGSGFAAMLAAALLGVRNGVYAVQLNALLRPGPRERFGMAHLTIDESTAIATAQPDRPEARRGFLAAGIGIFVLWNLFTLVGALVGDLIGDPRRYGLDGAAVAAFLGLLWPRLRGRDPIAIAVLCAVVTMVCVPVLPAGMPILVAAVVAASVGAIRLRRRGVVTS